MSITSISFQMLSNWQMRAADNCFQRLFTHIAEPNETAKQFAAKFRPILHGEFSKFGKTLDDADLNEMIGLAHKDIEIVKVSQVLESSVFESSKKNAYTFIEFFIWKFLLTKYPNVGDVQERDAAATKSRMKDVKQLMPGSWPWVETNPDSDSDNDNNIGND